MALLSTKCWRWIVFASKVWGSQWPFLSFQESSSFAITSQNTEMTSVVNTKSRSGPPVIGGDKTGADIKVWGIKTFFFVLWPPNKVRVLTGKGLTSSSSFWDQRLEPARQTTQLFEVTRWRHRFTTAFTLAGSASIPLSLTMKAKVRRQPDFTSFCLIDSGAQSKVGSKSRVARSCRESRKATATGSRSSYRKKAMSSECQVEQLSIKG